MAGGNSELAEVQEKLELLNTEYDRLNDEWTGRLAAQQDEFQREKYVSITDDLFACGLSFPRTASRSKERASTASHRKHPAYGHRLPTAYCVASVVYAV